MLRFVLQLLLFTTLLGMVAQVHASTAGNVALGKPVTMITTVVSGVPSNIVDGDRATACWSYTGVPSVIEFIVDLEAEQVVERVVVQVYQSSLFRVEASLDGATWDVLQEQAVGYYDNPLVEYVLVVPRTLRYLRYRAQNSANGYTGIGELEVYEGVLFADGFEEGVVSPS